MVMVKPTALILALMIPPRIPPLVWVSVVAMSLTPTLMVMLGPTVKKSATETP